MILCDLIHAHFFIYRNRVKQPSHLVQASDSTSDQMG